MHGAAWQHLVVAKIVQYFWRNREVNPYQWKKLLFGELLLSLKDMAPNYSRPAQALSVTAQMLTVILVLFRWRCKKMHHFWVHNIIRKRLQKNAYHNLAWVASYRILFCDATWINLSYSATSKPPDNLGGNSATPLFCHKSHVLAAWITPPRRNKIQRHFCLLLRLHHTHTESNQAFRIFHISNFCRHHLYFCSTAAPCKWIPGCRKASFLELPVPYVAFTTWLLDSTYGLLPMIRVSHTGVFHFILLSHCKHCLMKSQFIACISWWQKLSHFTVHRVD